MPDFDQSTLVEITTEVVAAYVARDSVPPGDLPALISSVDAALSGLDKAAA